MSKPFSLEPIRELAKQKSDDAAISLGKLRTQESQARQTLDTLENYRSEYRQRLDQALLNGISPADLHNYQAFLSKLDRAVEEQKTLVQQSETRSETGLQHWQVQTRKLKSFDVLASRERARQEQISSRQEQRTQDEFAASRAHFPKSYG